MQEISLTTRALEYAKQLQQGTGQAGHRMTINYLKAHGINQAIAEKYQLGFVGTPMDAEDRRFVNSLAIPYLTRAGVVSIKYRCVLDHNHREFDHQKYQQYHGQRTRFYNAEAFFTADETIGISEGEIDAIAATEHLGIPTLGIPGASQWQSNAKVWRLTLKDYSTIVVFADGDTAGLDCARTVATDLGSRAKLVKCDSDEDVASSIVKGQAMNLKSRAGL